MTKKTQTKKSELLITEAVPKDAGPDDLLEVLRLAEAKTRLSFPLQVMKTMDLVDLIHKQMQRHAAEDNMDGVAALVAQFTKLQNLYLKQINLALQHADILGPAPEGRRERTWFDRHRIASSEILSFADDARKDGFCDEKEYESLNKLYDMVAKLTRQIAKRGMAQ